MLGAFTLFIITVPGGMAVIFVFRRARRIDGGQDVMHALMHTVRVRGKLPTTSRTRLHAWSGTCAMLALLIVLAGCSAFSSNSGAPAEPITTLTLTIRTV